MARFSKYLVVCVALTGSLLVGSNPAVVAQTSAQAGIAAKEDYAGTWNWMYHDKRFATMILRQEGDQIAGTMTNGHIDTDGQGKITNAVPAKGSTPIVKSTLEKGRLILLAKDREDETEFAMTLTSPTTAELRFSGAGAPGNAEPIRLEKVWSEPPVDK